MSTAKSITRQLEALGFPALPLANRQGLRILLVGVALFASAFGIIVVKDMNRRLFIQYQNMQSQHEKQYENWGSLSLEQSTLSTPSRVQRIAKNRLMMEQANPKDVSVID